MRAGRLKGEMLDECRDTLDIERLLRVFSIAKRNAVTPVETVGQDNQLRLEVARDQAFCFYYPENLRMLQEAGAQIVEFSPVSAERVPDGVSGIYIGGGYPESFAAELATNISMLESIRTCDRAGMPIYAECGGMMYLSRALIGFDGRRHPMASLLPVEVRMESHHLVIRYVEIRTTVDSVLGPRGTRARGHEFHHSRLVDPPPGIQAFKVRDSSGKRFATGFRRRNILASYLHLHFASNPTIPRAFVEECSRFRRPPRVS